MGSIFQLDEPQKHDSGSTPPQQGPVPGTSDEPKRPGAASLIFPDLAGASNGGGWIVNPDEPATESSTNIFADLALNPQPGEWVLDPGRTIAKFTERVFPTIALGGVPGPWELDSDFHPVVSEDLFALRLAGKLPALRNLASSVVVHGAVIALMMTISIPVTRAVEPAQELAPTEIRIGDHLYYVADISGQEQGQASPASAKKDLPRAASVGKSGTPRPAPALAREPAASAAAIPAPSLRIPSMAAAPAVVEAAAKASADAAAAMTREAAERTEAARREAKRALTRTFIPPQVKRSPTATQTLIQPLSPPDLVPPPTPLPSFRMITPQFPKLSRRFVAPGRKTELPPAQAPAVPEPEIQLAQAQPVDVDLQPKLPLPVAPPPSPVKPAPSPTPASTGEPINILSVSDRAVPLTDRIVVPPGNIVQDAPIEAAASAGKNAASDAAGKNAAETTAASARAATGTNGSASAAGRGATGAGTVPAAAASTTQAPGSGSGRGTAVSGPGPADSKGTSQTPALANTAPGGTGLGNSPVARPGAGAGSGTVAAGGNSTGNQTGSAASGNGDGRGRGSVGTGTGSALAGASPTGNPTATVGGSGGGATGGETTGSGTGGSGNGGTAASGNGSGSAVPGLINRSPSGTFDAVVVQTSPLDQYPETRGLLTGRPIYSVYVNVGTQRDWTLYYCIPNERPPQDNSNVVNLGGPQPAPVKAPYPYKMLRPQVKLPTWAKYVLVHGFVNAQGKLEGMKVVRSVLPDIDKAVLTSLTEWEFRAAARSDAPILVEVLLSIPAAGI
ncbi:MAG: hypothetical protein ABL995_06540 [Bryobacteraceae bacterium]